MHNWRRRTSSGSSNEVLLPHSDEETSVGADTSCGITGITSIGENSSYQGASYQHGYQDTFSDVVLTSENAPNCPYNSRITSYNSNGYSRTGISKRNTSDVDDQRSGGRSKDSKSDRSNSERATQKGITKRSGKQSSSAQRNVTESHSEVLPQVNNRKDMNVLSENCCLRCCVMITPNICRRIFSFFKR